MATVQKRSNSYKITVSCGYDTSGKQIRKTMTWSPAPNMTAKQIEKELERQKVLFEERRQSGMFVDGKIKLSDFAELWYKNYAEKQDTTKNKSSERIIQVPRDMIELLAEYKKEQLQMRLKVGDKWNESGKIFTTPFGDPIHPDSLSSWFSKFIKKNNLPDIHLHSLRHTNATLLIANGTNIRTVAKRLGHASPTTTGNIYAHAIKTADEMASDTLQDILNQRKKSLKIQK